jgi:hypothetical protein
MRKITTLIAFVIIANFCSAQKITEDSLVNLMAMEACTEMENKGVDGITKENMDMKLGMLFLNSFQKHQADLEELYGESYLTDRVKLRKIGEKIGFKMGLSCKAFQNFIINNGEALLEDRNTKTDKPSLKKNEDMKLISGKIIGYTKEEFSYFTIKTNDNINVKLYWLNSFYGADLLINNSKGYLNKEVAFNYKEVSMFDGVKQSYNKIKVIEAFFDGEIKEDVQISTKTVKEN